MGGGGWRHKHAGIHAKPQAGENGGETTLFLLPQKGVSPARYQRAAQVVLSHRMGMYRGSVLSQHSSPEILLRMSMFECPMPR